MALPQGKQLFTTILGDCESSLSDADVGTVALAHTRETGSRRFLHVAATYKVNR